MDGKITFKQTDGTMAVGDKIDVELDDSDPSWNGATWDCTSEGNVQATTTIGPSPGAYLAIKAKATGSYSVTATLVKSAYYWTASGTFTGTALEPASISLSDVTKTYDGKSISLDNLAQTDSDGRLSYAFEQLKNGAWQQVDSAEVVGEGRHRVTATTEQTNTHAAGTATQEFEILPAAVDPEGTDASNAAGSSADAGSPSDASTRSASAAAAPAPQASVLPNTGDATQPMVPLALSTLGAAA